MARWIDIDPIVEKIKYSLSLGGRGEYNEGYDAALNTVMDYINDELALTPPNEPLSIEQLREMDRFSPPIWDNCLHDWCAVRPNVCAGQQGISYIGGGCRPLESGRFYRRPPEGGEESE